MTLLEESSLEENFDPQGPANIEEQVVTGGWET